MSSLTILPPANPSRPSCGTAIALHCSGSSGGQWRGLAEAGRGRFELVTPDLYGCGHAADWTGEGAFALADEALGTIAAIDRASGPVHLVGHSYGGAVALHAALRRSDRVASIAVYEPTVFHLLPWLGENGAAAHAEIKGVAAAVAEGVLSGDYRGAAGRFIDYWGGDGAWDALKPELQAEIARWIIKAPLDFRALFNDPTPIVAYAGMRCPVLVLRGAHAPDSTRLVATLLGDIAPLGRSEVIGGAGHMGPLTHAAEVNRRIVEHIEHAQRTRQPWRAAG